MQKPVHLSNSKQVLVGVQFVFVAFVATIVAAKAKFGWPGTLLGVIAVGIVYSVVSAII